MSVTQPICNPYLDMDNESREKAYANLVKQYKLVAEKLSLAERLVKIDKELAILRKGY